MIKQLKDFISIDEIIVNSSDCITSLFSALSADDYNAELIAILNTNKDELSLEYLGNRLDKTLAPIYSRLIDKYIADGYSNTEAIIYANTKLIKVIENKYLTNWNKLAIALFSEYNPINNYDMTENKKINVNTEMNVTGTTSESETNKIAGFNSDEASVVTEGKKSGSQITDTTGAKNKNEQEEELTRSGNIGVTTSQQMIESEIKLRRANIIDIIFNDMDKILFLDYYL